MPGSSPPASATSWSTAREAPPDGYAGGSTGRPPSWTPGTRWTSGDLLEDLHGRGVRRLMVEGGGNVLTQFLTGDLADELQLVVAPFFVGDARASRFVGTGRFPFHPGRRATLAEVRPIGDVVLLRYALSPLGCSHVGLRPDRARSWTSASRRFLCWPAEPRTLEDLAGGLTNRNVKVTTPDGVSSSRVQRRQRRGPRHRPRGGGGQLAGRGGGGCRCPGRRGAAPTSGLLVIGFLEGATLTQRGLPCRRVRDPRPAASHSPAPPGTAVRQRLRHVRAPAALPRAVREPAASASPTGYDDHAGRFAEIRKALAVLDEGTVPCNNDLLAENFIDDGEKIWLIDYEYSGNNDACFELGNTWASAGSTPSHLDELVAAYFGELAAPTRSRAPGCRRSSRSTAGRCGASSRTPSARSTTTSGSGGWSATRGRSREMREP